MKEEKNEHIEFTLTLDYKQSFWNRMVKRKEAKKTFVFREAKLCTVRKVTAALLALPNELKGNTNIDISLPFISGHLDRLIYIVGAGIQNDSNEPKKSLLKFLEANCGYTQLMDGVKYSLASIGMMEFIDTYAMLKGSAAIISFDEDEFQSRVAGHSRESSGIETKDSDEVFK